MKRFYWQVIGILVLAFVLRVWGANFGLGFSILHPDEAIYLPYIKQTFPFERTSAFDALKARGDYPSLFYYYYSSAFWLASKFSEIFPNVVPAGWSLDHWLLLWGRVATAILSTLGVYLVIGIGRRLFNEKVGLWAGLFLAISFIDVQVAHYVKHDVLVQALGLAVVWNLLNFLESKAPRYLVLAGALFLMAARVKTIGFFLAFPLLVSFLLLFWRRLQAKRNIRALAVVGGLLMAGGLVVFFLGPSGLPWGREGLSVLINRRSRLLLGPFREGTHIAYSNLDGIPNCIWWPLYLVTSGLFLPQFLASVVGFFIFLKEKLPAKYLVLSLVIPYYLVLSLQRFRADRWIIFITPYLAIFAALFWERLLGWVKKSGSRRVLSRILVFLACLIFLGVSLLRSAAFSLLIARKDTRYQAKEWIAENYPPDQPLFMIGAANVIGESLKGGGHYNTFILFPLYGREIFQYPRDLMVICSGTYRSVENYQNLKLNKDIWENYLLIREKGELVKEFSRPLFRDRVFSPFSLENSATVNSYHNPTVQIYRLPDIPEYTGEGMPVFTNFARYMETNMHLLEEGAGGTLFSDGSFSAVAQGSKKILKDGDYLFECFVDIQRCDVPGARLEIAAVSFDGEREFAREVFECARVLFSDKLSLPLHLEKTSSVNFVFQAGRGVGFTVERAVLTRK